MPTYEYRCPDGHDFEKFFRKISDAPADVACPVCGKIAERRLSAGAGLLFKGSGFYLTDYGKNAHRGDGSGLSEAKGESKGEGKSESSSSSESKSEAKSSSSASDSAPKPSDAKPAAAPAPKSSASDK